ncbi:hypothetical protein EBE87_24300 [Pseudoroseomonas wenyumeiae]|uniref:DUF3606 domain-containing protein n=1 Tax=Teichococcus wenyumeiae TaxID=2478470 RepID=A0A3A9JBB4_9PROT|nr:hypothetical protein [Pseudoroseomonas wenyumeiae]RKK03772.1 hypothetical protein D6Z83_12960 [Pseudoroseomonas wenyumeiae]RMI17056.1 hypothetical protein EBE87_24300 [Pseudoroseomonas wenyumeiae]
MTENKQRAESGGPGETADLEAEVAYLAKRHRVSSAVIREIIRNAGSSERSVVERDLQKGKSRR